MSASGRETRGGRVEEENNQNYRKLNQNYQKFILFNDNSNNLRGNQLPAALKGRAGGALKKKITKIIEN